MVDFVGRTHGGEYAGHLPCRQAPICAQRPFCCRVYELILGFTRFLLSHCKTLLQTTASVLPAYSQTALFEQAGELFSRT